MYTSDHQYVCMFTYIVKVVSVKYRYRYIYVGNNKNTLKKHNRHHELVINALQRLAFPPHNSFSYL